MGESGGESERREEDVGCRGDVAGILVCVSVCAMSSALPLTPDGHVTYVQRKACPTGAIPQRGSRIKVSYTGRLPSGDVFDSSAGFGVEFN